MKSNQHQRQAQQQIIRWPELAATIGLSRTTVWRLERAGQFARRLRLSARNVGWLREDVDRWIDQRKAGANV